MYNSENPYAILLVSQRSQYAIFSQFGYKMEAGTHAQLSHTDTYAKAFFQHFKALKCIFMLHYLYYQVHKAILEEKCIVMELKNFEYLDKYDPKQVLFLQECNDKEELLKRLIQEQKILWISGKLVEQHNEKKRKKKKQDKKNCTKKRKLS